MILKCRCPQLSVLSTRIGMIVRHSEASHTGLDTLYYHGVCSHPSTIVKKAQRLGINHDGEVLRWKQSAQEYHNMFSCLKSLKACLEDLAYLKDQPTVTDVDNMLSKQREISNHSNGVIEIHPDNEYTTLDVNCLQLACLATPDKTVEYVYNHLTETHSRDEVIDCFQNVIAAAAKEDGIDNLLHARSISIKNIHDSPPTGYQIIGDNLDMYGGREPPWWGVHAFLFF